MSGFGRTLVRGLAGAAKGYGDYLIGEGQRQVRAQEADALMNREMALARFRQSLGDESATRTGDEALGRDLKRTAFTAQENRLSTRLELGQRGEIARQGQAAENHEWDRRQAAQYRTWLRQQGVEQDTWESRQQYIQEHNPNRHIRWDVRDSDNQRVGYDLDTGEIIETGVTVRRNSVDLFSDLGSGGDGNDVQPEAGAGAGAPAPAPSRGGGRPAAAPAPRRPAPRANPPVAGARLAPDGKWYVQRNGRWFRVES